MFLFYSFIYLFIYLFIHLFILFLFNLSVEINRVRDTYVKFIY